jgi:hypothetical protein
MSKGPRNFVIYDSRAAYGDPSEAAVLEACGTMPSNRHVRAYGSCCAVYSYAPDGSDERLEKVVT